MTKTYSSFNSHIKVSWLILFTFLFTTDVSACSCVKRYGHLKKASRKADIVAIITVNEHIEFNGRTGAMGATIKEVWKGQETKKNIRIWGDKTGGDCRPNITEFTIGSQWVVALISTREENTESYAVSGCGVFFLQINDGKVHGNIKRKRVAHKLTLAEVKKLF